MHFGTWEATMTESQSKPAAEVRVQAYKELTGSVSPEISPAVNISEQRAIDFVKCVLLWTVGCFMLSASTSAAAFPPARFHDFLNAHNNRYPRLRQDKKVRPASSAFPAQSQVQAS